MPRYSPHWRQPKRFAILRALLNPAVPRLFETFGLWERKLSRQGPDEPLRRPRFRRCADARLDGNS
ncbi:hypothetical protein KL86PLE_130274 [uncultured Pleomorphomonas sp.]|uniref:Uncharacterized protein n=1 Tax=uncultured Pleomorphomonas sp. TaxID=442121 RepID=A0A212LAS3_9HYPH|nr:hypothetical protein KL86PLE_130274 [uncultured Pleomorphomonas sp.]